MRAPADEPQKNAGSVVLAAHQFVHVAEPRRFFTLVALDPQIGRAGVAAIVQHDAKTAARDLLRHRHEFVIAAPAAGGRHHPRTALADDLPIDVDAVDFAEWHWTLPTPYALPTGAPQAHRLERAMGIEPTTLSLGS